MSEAMKDGTKVLSIRIPALMQSAISVEAKKRGLHPSTYIKTILFEKFPIDE